MPTSSNHVRYAGAFMNEAFGWVWIVLGFATGVPLGMRFANETWLGGYGSWRRRLLRLGHVSFFGLGLLNILFALGTARMVLSTACLQTASWAFVVGGISMPAACALVAFDRRWKPFFVFSLPVTSLLVGGGLAALGMVRGALGLG